jgi:hypothetical protein
VTNVRVRVFNAGLLARSQFAFGRSCDRTARSGFSLVFLGARANAELEPKFHVELFASHAALPMLDQISLLRSPSNVINSNSHHIHDFYKWHCLGTFKSGNRVLGPPSPNVVSLTTSPLSLSSLSL